MGTGTQQELFARYLGVTRQHLYMVIRGERRSPRIERYLAEHMVKGEEGR